MKVKVSEATKNQLNWMVAVCEHKALRHKYGAPTFDPKTKRVYETEGLRQIGVNFAPTTDWSQGGPIIETKIDCLRKRSKAEETSLAYPNPNFKFKAGIFADIDGYFCAFGPTPLIAGLRCVVMSELGEIVEVPDELA